MKLAPSRIWRRLCRTRLIGPLLSGLEDWISLCSMQGNPTYRRGAEAFAGVSNVDELFEIAQLIFGAHQKKSEICKFLQFMKERSPVLICEIGVAAGGTHFLLREGIPSVSKIIGVEIALKRSVAKKLQYFRRKEKQDVLVQGPSCAPETLSRIKAELHGQQFDLLFVDGDHEYAGAKQDFACYRQFVRDGGIIAFHDIVADHRGRPGVATANWSGGVPVLWAEVKERFVHWEIVEHPDQDAFGIGLLEYRSSPQQ